MTTVEDFLNAGGAPYASFPTPGTTIKGTVESTTVKQQTDFNSGAPLMWPDGNPRMQLVVTLATDERDAAIDNDDGRRDVYAKGQMLAALKDALHAVGAKAPEAGGTLAVQYKEDKPSDKGFPQKIYVVQYKAPAASAVAVDELI